MKGGKREGAGRPKGSVKAEGVRPQHQLRAYPDEWQMILKFARLIKHGEKRQMRRFLESIRLKSDK